jgi:hypothetical protein
MRVILRRRSAMMSDRRYEHPPTGSLEIFRENLRRCLDGEPLLNQVDWERG